MEILDFDYIKQGNCLDLIKQLPDDSIDLTVTSPPYDNLRTYGGLVEWSFESFQTLAKEMFRITKKGGVCVWNVSDAVVNGSETGSSFRQALFFKDIGFNLHDTMIWKKDVPSFPDATRYAQCFEYMFVLTKGKPKTIHKIADRKNKYAGAPVHGTSRNPDGHTFRKANDKKSLVKDFGERWNVWEFPTEKQNKTGHPAVFPIRMPHDHIISWTEEGDVVFDPFLGSGTTAIAAVRTNRHYIGFEINPDYFQTACDRLTAEASISFAPEG